MLARYVKLVHIFMSPQVAVTAARTMCMTCLLIACSAAGVHFLERLSD